MARLTSTLRLLVATTALLAVVATGCGVKANKDLTASTSTTSGTTAPSGGGSSGGSSGGSATTTPTDPSTTDGSGSGPGSGGSTETTEPAFGGIDIKGLLTQTFENEGLSHDKAACLAQGFVDAGLTDPSKLGSFDYTKLQNVFAKCGVTPAELGGLGRGGN